MQKYIKAAFRVYEEKFHIYKAFLLFPFGDLFLVLKALKLLSLQQTVDERMKSLLKIQRWKKNQQPAAIEFTICYFVYEMQKREDTIFIYFYVSLNWSQDIYCFASLRY